METRSNPRPLTHDERKAAEAAFSGRPCNPLWSDSAKKVYKGLLDALSSTAAKESDITEQPQMDPLTKEGLTEVCSAQTERPVPEGQSPIRQLILNRQEAIQAGFLIDVTAAAQKLGLTFPVTITRPLWDIGIAPEQGLSDQEKGERLRDILMAFRLRLAGQTTLAPLIDFPAMLALPPGAVPQPVPLFALIYQDEQNGAMATLLLPNEVAATIIPMN